MLTKEERDKISALVRRQVVPAIGCTEPVCVALAAARAAELLEERPPARVTVRLSANILKNAMGVGVPGTGMVGLPIAIALGMSVGRSEYGLEVLRDVDDDAVTRARTYINKGCIDIGLASDAPDKLYADVVCVATDGRESRVVIAHEHTHIIHEECAGKVLSHEEVKPESADGEKAALCGGVCLTLRKVWEYATASPLEEIQFIDEARRLNLAAAEQSLAGNYGHRLGKALSRPLGRGLLGDSMFSHILSSTSLACDARMAGAPIPVMSNSGSGNQGICATNPVAVFALENHNTAEELTRALMLSHLTAIYIKQHMGTLSALCGCVVASTGSSCGITYLMGGGYKEVSYAVQNMIANLTGMICDGAKPSCALKLTSGVSTAVLSAMLAMQGEHVTSVEGIIDDDVDQSIRNLVAVGTDAMDETDRCVLHIMTNKKQGTAHAPC
ncbi:MAG: serine dehydratase subunit alpha family protein [Alloprevotella sp.]|nr:serine dehydratase subunit alpha family protein [Alloprevotella sp.]